MISLLGARPQERLAIAAEILLVLVVGSLAIVGFIRVLPALVPIPEQVDLAAYYLAAQVLNSLGPLYDPGAMAQAAAGSGGINYTAYIYPPFLAALFRPVAFLPYDLARTLWFALNLAFLFTSVALLARVVGLSPMVAAIIGLMALLMPAVYDTLRLGQANLLLLLLLTVSLYLSSTSPSSRWQGVVAGGLLGIATAIKLYPAVLGFGYLLRRRYLSLSSTVLTVLDMSAFGVVAGGGWGNTMRYFSEILPAIVGVTAFPSNQSIQAVFARFFSINQFRFSVLTPDNYVTVTFNPLLQAPALGAWLAHAGTGVIALATISSLALRRRPGQGSPSLLLDLALLLAAALLTTPIVWDHYYVLLLIPMFALAWDLRQSGQRYIRLALLLSCLFLILQRYWRWLTPFMPSPWLLGFGFYGTLTLWVALLSASVAGHE